MTVAVVLTVVFAVAVVFAVVVANVVFVVVVNGELLVVRAAGSQGCCRGAVRQRARVHT